MKLSIGFTLICAFALTFALENHNDTHIPVMRKAGQTRFKRDSVSPKCYEKCVHRRGIKFSYYCFYRECYSKSTTTTSTHPPYWFHGGYWGWEQPHWGGKSHVGESWGGKSHGSESWGK
ncbi:hypothetical protein CHUAL_011334 [Chamberlinius hualienensis]